MVITISGADYSYYTVDGIEMIICTLPGQKRQFLHGWCSHGSGMPRLPSRWHIAAAGEGVVHAWFMHGWVEHAVAGERSLDHKPPLASRTRSLFESTQITQRRWHSFSSICFFPSLAQNVLLAMEFSSCSHQESRERSFCSTARATSLPEKWRQRICGPKATSNFFHFSRPKLLKVCGFWALLW